MPRKKTAKIPINQPPTGDEPKRRGRPPAPPAPSPGNVTQETRKDIWRRALTAKIALEDAQNEVKSCNGHYRSVLKDAKKLGVDPVAIIFALNARLRDPDEVTREIQQINWMVMAAGLPIGAQLGLFSDGESVATKVDNEALARQGAHFNAGGRAVGDDGVLGEKAYHLGREFSSKGENRDKNPYDSGLYPKARERFNQGWDDDTAERVRAMDGGGAAAAAPPS